MLKTIKESKKKSLYEEGVQLVKQAGEARLIMRIIDSDVEKQTSALSTSCPLVKFSKTALFLRRSSSDKCSRL